MRRSLLTLLAAAALVGCGAPAPGRGPAADERGSRVEKVTMASDAVGKDLPMSVVIPEGGERGRPIVVFLHGRGQNESTFLNDEFFGALEDLGDRAPIVAFPYGDDHSYFHNRADGAWGDSITGEVIPEVVDQFGADGDRVAIGGVSMGGFGAYDLARLNPGLFCGVAGHSPALWEAAGDTPSGAFDDADDFAAHDVIGAARDPDSEAFTHERLWLDRGDADPFVAADDAFIEAVDAKAGTPIDTSFGPGDHETGYWNSHWAYYLGFYADALEACGAPDG